MNTLFITSFIVLVLVSLSACESTTTRPAPVETPSKITEPVVADDIQSLLITAETAAQSRANELRIRAAERADEKGDLQQATKILAMVDHVSDPGNAQRYILLKAGIAIQSGDGQSALDWLNDPRLGALSLTQTDQVNIGELRARAFYAGRSYLASARERMFFNPLLSPERQSLNHDEIYKTLMELPEKSLATQARRAITSDLRGWLSLAAMAKQHQNDPLKQLRELNRWKMAWSNHPAATKLPASLRTLSQVVKNQPKSIALLLPLQGNLGIYGRSIRDGIIAARFQLNSNVQINIFDTSVGDIHDLIDEAVNKGAEMIIGPLDRNLVTKIASRQNLPVPVLALNRTNNGLTHTDLYQFGLAPEDETLQVADTVFREGKRNALAIFPADEWGTRNFEAFENRWISLGGTIIDAAEYSDQRDYSDFVKSLLNVDMSEDRARDLRRILGQRFEFTPRRRQDIDFIFLLGNQSQARGINPTLAFFYAEDIPVYSTSHVHEFNDSRIESIDLNGIRFCDIPWKLTSGDFIQNEIQLAWPRSKAQLAPFYALGVDAFRLYPRLQQLKVVTNGKIYGVTGVLQLNSNNVLVRKLMWAQFSNGEVVVIPLVADSGTDFSAR